MLVVSIGGEGKESRGREMAERGVNLRSSDAPLPSHDGGV